MFDYVTEVDNSRGGAGWAPGSEGQVWSFCASQDPLEQVSANTLGGSHEEPDRLPLPGLARTALPAQCALFSQSCLPLISVICPRSLCAS